MGSLLVVTGPPGAGKSTVARILADGAEPSVLVEGDAFFRFLVRGAIPPWLEESNGQNEIVTKAAASAAGLFASGSYSTVYDGVLGPWFLPVFASATGLRQLDHVILLPSVEVCLERIRTRRDHGFRDENAARHMHAEFTNASINSRHVLIDPPETAEGVVSVINERRGSGSFLYTM